MHIVEIPLNPHVAITTATYILGGIECVSLIEDDLSRIHTTFSFQFYAKLMALYIKNVLINHMALFGSVFVIISHITNVIFFYNFGSFVFVSLFHLAQIQLRYHRFVDDTSNNSSCSLSLCTR